MKIYTFLLLASSFLLLICSSSLYASQKTLSITSVQQEQKEKESLSVQLAEQLKNYVEATTKIKKLLLAGAQPNASFIQCASADHTLFTLLQEVENIHKQRSVQLSTATLQAASAQQQKTTGSVARPLKSILKVSKEQREVQDYLRRQQEWAEFDEWDDDNRRQQESDDWINGKY